MNPYNFYKDQNKIFKNGKYSDKYAYVYILMKSTDLFESYLLGTLVSAYALKKQKVKNKIIILVTKDIEKKYYKLILTIFDKIYVIDYYFPSEKFTKDISHDRWKYLYTKINLFKLIKYEKIVFINSNLLPIRNCDYLFNYKTPAAVPYLREFDIFRLLTENKSINKEDKYIEDVKIFYKNSTSKKLKKIKKYKNLFEYDNDDGWMNASMLIFKPDMKTYNDLKKILDGNDKKYKNYTFTNDEIFFSYYFRKEWNFVNPRYNSMLFSGKYPYLEYIFILNYQMGKPFFQKNKKKFKNYPEYKLWVSYLVSMIKHYPKLTDFVKKIYYTDV